MTKKERFTVDSDGNYWDKINHRYVNLDYLFRLVEELDAKLDNKQHTINELTKTIRIYDNGYIDLNKKYKKVVDENGELKKENSELRQDNEHIETCFKMADSTYHILQKQYWNVENALSKYRKENLNLKKALLEAEIRYIEGKNEFSIDIEKDMENLKKDFEREYWNE